MSTRLTFLMAPARLAPAHPFREIAQEHAHYGTSSAHAAGGRGSSRMRRLIQEIWILSVPAAGWGLVLY